MSLPALFLFFPLLTADPPARPLFNGKNLEGWVVEGAREFKEGAKSQPVWVVRDGMICCMVKSGSFGFLRYTEQQFDDFELSLEYRFEPPSDPKGRRGNSGIGIRTTPFDPKKSRDSRPSYASYEIQLLDDADKAASKGSTGSLYRYVAPKEQAAKPAPEWNKIEIRCVGPQVIITLNGKKIVDFDQSTHPELKKKPLKGYICLQNHGSRIDFRNIHLRELKPSAK